MSKISFPHIGPMPLGLQGLNKVIPQPATIRAQIRKRLNKYRVHISTISGQILQSEKPITILYAGKKTLKNYLINQFFGRRYSETLITKAWLWNLEKKIHENSDGANFVFMEIDKHFRFFFNSRRSIMIPSWEHFSSGKKDRLLILVLKRNADIIAIAPFRIGILKGKPFPIRVIRMIPEWNGDKPRILTCENEAIVWESVFKFFKYDFKDWDKIDLAEIVFGGGTKINHEVIEIIGCRCTIKPETVSCSIATRGWDDYISGLSKNTKRMLKRNESKLSRLPTKLGMIIRGSLNSQPPSEAQTDM